MDRLTSLSDEALIDRLQRGAFSYLTEFANDDNGLVADTSREGSPCSIAVVGFALSCYPVAVKNGWISRAAAATQTLKTLRFFWNSPQSDRPDATGYKGFYYHFLHMKTGRRVWQCELSLVDTTLLLAGVLMRAGENGPAEEMLQGLRPGEAYMAPTGLAIFYLICGETGQVAYWIEKAIEQRDPAIMYLPCRTFGKALLSGPLWPPLAKMMNLPETT